MMGFMKSEYPTCHCKSRPLNITLGPFDRDERVDEIDRILELLIESRYGPGRYYQPYEMPRTMLRAETVNYDLMPTGIALLFSNECFSVFRSELAGKAGKELGLGSTADPAAFLHVRNSPSTLARGSPHHRRPYINL